MSNEEDRYLDWDDDDDVSVVAPPPRLTGGSIVDEVTSPGSTLGAYERPRLFSPPGVLSVSEDDANPEDSDKLAVVQMGSDGVATRTVIDFASPPLTREEATVLTENIRSATNVLYILIKRAHAGKAWEALGYSSFKEYVSEEFQLSRSYAYKLLDQAKVIEAIQAAAPEGTEVYVTESASRTLKGSLPDLIAEVSERTAGLSPEEAKTIVEEVINDSQEAHTRANSDDPFANEDFELEEPVYGENEPFGGGNNYQEGGNGEYSGNGGDNYRKDYQNPDSSFDFADNYYSDSDFAEDEEEEDIEDTAYRVQKLERLYNIITTLRSIGEYAEDYNLDELFEILPPDREEDITRLFEIDLEWMRDAKDRWTRYLSNKPIDSSGSTSYDEFED